MEYLLSSHFSFLIAVLVFIVDICNYANLRSIMLAKDGAKQV